MITITFSNGETREVPPKIANMYTAFTAIYTDLTADVNSSTEAVEITHTTPIVYDWIHRYCETHCRNLSPKELADFDTEYIKAMFASQTPETMPRIVLDVLHALKNLFTVDSLHNLIIKTIASKMKGMTVEEIRIFHGITNDFDNDEYEKIKSQNVYINQHK